MRADIEVAMQLFIGLLLVSAFSVSMTTNIRSISASGRNAQDFQSRKLHAAGLPVNGQDDDRQRSIQDYHNVLSPSNPYGDMRRMTIECIMDIAKAGIKRVFPRCKAYVKQVIQFCLSPNGKKMYAKECWKVSMSIGIAIDECHTPAKPVTELCRTLLPPKEPISYRPSYQSVTAGKTSAEIQGHFHPVKDYNPRSRTPGALVEVHTLPIGQGDCTVIYCNGGQHAILFDCGSSEGKPLDKQFIQSYFEDVLSITVMISHADEDHYNKIPEVFDLNTDKGKKFMNKIEEVIVGGPRTDYANDTEPINNWLNEQEVKNRVKYQSDSSRVQEYDFCKDKDIDFKIVVGDRKSNSKNEWGMVMKMSCKSCNSSLLFPGDMEGAGAKVMARRSKDTNDAFFGILNVTHCKMAHHGASRLANKLDWLKAISPIEVIVSHVYNGSRYGHPRCEAIDRLLSIGTIALLKDNAHNFDCIINQTRRVNNTQVNHIVHRHTQYRIYSTAPTSDENCAIVLLFRKNQEATTDIYCGKHFRIPSNAFRNGLDIYY